MKFFKGVWMPDEEEHLYAHLMYEGERKYQHKGLQMAMKYVRDWDVAIDVGANIGLWSLWLVEKFGYVYAFEPVEEFRECFVRNVQLPNYCLVPFAVSNIEGDQGIYVDKKNCGATHLGYGSGVKTITLDNYFRKENLGALGFMKIDVEGMEFHVMHGAWGLLKKHKPVVYFEDKHSERYNVTSEDCHKFLRDLGYEPKAQYGKDFIYV